MIYHFHYRTMLNELPVDAEIYWTQRGDCSAYRVAHRECSPQSTVYSRNICSYLGNGKLGDAVISALKNPSKGPVDISDPDIPLSLDVFIGCKNASEATYNAVRAAVQETRR